MKKHFGLLRGLQPVKFSLLARFSLASFLLTLLIAVALTWGIQRELLQTALQVEAQGAANQVATILTPNLRLADLIAPLEAARYQQIDDLIRRNFLREHIVRVKIWSRDGLLLYSDEQALVGRSFPVTENLQQALSGEIAMEVSALQGEENVAEQDRYDQLLEVYVPLQPMDSPEVAGIYEIYTDMAVIQPHIDAMRRSVWATVGLGFLVLYGALFTLVRNASRQLIRRNEKLTAINTIAAAVNQSPNLNDMLATALTEIEAALSLRHSEIWLFDAQSSQLRPGAHHGLPDDFALEIPAWQVGVGLPGIVARSRQPLFIENLGADARFLRVRGSQYGLHSGLGIPLTDQEGLVGVMNFFSHTGERFTPKIADYLATVGHLVGAAVRNARLYEAAQRALAERVKAEQALQKYSERLEEMVAERTQELQDAQEKLIRQERLAALGELAGGVGHELRNPLGVITNAIYYLNMVLPEADEKVKEYLGIIQDNTRQATRIVSGLLDFGRVESVDRSPTRVPEMIANVLAQHPAPENVTVTLDLPADLPPALVDPRQIEQVLSNLVTNAYQAMPEGGQLTIDNYESTIDGSGVAMIGFCIRDTGSGIPPENMDKLFEPLFTTKARGIGLGLAVSKKLVEANGGRIDVDSEYGTGTTFSVSIPAAEE